MKAIKIKVQVEGVTSQEEIELKIESKIARVRVSHECDLNIELPFEVEERKGHAQFLKERKELEITLPVSTNQTGLLPPSQSRDLPAAADWSRDDVPLLSEACQDCNEDATSEEPSAFRQEYATKEDTSGHCMDNSGDPRLTANEIRWRELHAQLDGAVAENSLYPVPSISGTDTSNKCPRVQAADDNAVSKEPIIQLDNILTID